MGGFLGLSCPALALGRTLPSTVLCCAVLCCAVLCCAVLCCAVLCCAVRCQLPRSEASVCSQSMCGAAPQMCRTLAGTASANSTASAPAYRFAGVTLKRVLGLLHAFVRSQSGISPNRATLKSLCGLRPALPAPWSPPTHPPLQANKAGVDEALMLDPQGFVATCNSTNFFIVREGEVEGEGGLQGLVLCTHKKACLHVCWPLGSM